MGGHLSRKAPFGGALFTLVLAAELHLDAAQSGPFTYRRVGETIVITGYEGIPEGEIEIPDEFEGIPVAAIGPETFADAKRLAGLEIPATLNTIGEGAFANCTELATVSVRPQVARTRTSLVGAIEPRAFQNCGKLVAFTILDGTKHVGDRAFQACQALERIRMPASLTSIGDAAFSRCASLRQADIPPGVTSLGTWAFRGCSSLQEVSVPLRVTTIDAWTFSSCSALARVSIPDGVRDIRSYAFASCSSLASVSIPDSVTLILRGAFAECSSLKSITIPDRVAIMQDGVFEQCGSLESIDVGSKNRSYSSRDGVLFDRAQRVLIRYPGGRSGPYAVPRGTAEISPNAFGECAGLTRVVISDTVRAIGPGAFQGCSHLTDIDVDPGNKHYESVDGVVFEKGGEVLVVCPGGRHGAYVIPPGVATIAEQAFSGCATLTEISIGAGVSRICGEAFQHCGGLTSITFSPGITDIEEEAFSRCFELKDAFFLGDAPRLGRGVFSSVAPGFSVHYMPGSSGFASPEWDRYAVAELREGAPPDRGVAFPTLAATLVAPARARTWTDSTGQHAIEAEFVGLASGVVTLRRADGTEATVPLAKLSEGDRRVAESLAATSEAPPDVEPE